MIDAADENRNSDVCAAQRSPPAVHYFSPRLVCPRQAHRPRPRKAGAESNGSRSNLRGGMAGRSFIRRCLPVPRKRDMRQAIARWKVGHEAGFLEAIRRYYNDAVIMDVDAGFTLGLVRADGSKIEVRSFQSQAFMIPWKITTANREFETFDVGVSQAIAKLLPDGFLNRQRIIGTPNSANSAMKSGPCPEHCGSRGVYNLRGSFPKRAEWKRAVSVRGGMSGERGPC